MTRSTPSDATQRLLAERYGAESPGRRWRFIVVAGLVAAVGLGWLLWAAWSQADPEVEARLVSWQVVSAREVQVELLIHRDTRDAVECTVSAQAVDAAVVGEKTVRLAAGESGERRLETVVTTERRATAVTVSDCR